jgi:hypothetical protein
MNKHLNIYQTYTNTHREYQLENDLTRALAICLQEDTLFFHEVLKSIMSSTDRFDGLFENEESKPKIEISIQKATSSIKDFEHIFAVSLSETECGDFWSQTHNANYDPICDLVIQVNEVLIVIEAKRDNVDCTAQLYNQILNINGGESDTLNENKTHITPYDLNWKKLMEIAVRTFTFQKATSNTNRFLEDFIELVKRHNFRWFPLASLRAIEYKAKSPKIYERFKLATERSKYVLIDSDRIGLVRDLGYASEVLFNLDTNPISIAIYPGNTKQQGWQIFSRGANFRVRDSITISGKEYKVHQAMHIKFTSWQKYFTGLWFSENDLKDGKQIYTNSNFLRYVGRKRRGNQWEEIAQLFDNCFKEEYKWREKCDWDGRIEGSGRSQFDMSFGYELSVSIPYDVFQIIDQTKEDILPLVHYLEEISNQIGQVLEIEKKINL